MSSVSDSRRRATAAILAVALATAGCSTGTDPAPVASAPPTAVATPTSAASPDPGDPGPDPGSDPTTAAPDPTTAAPDPTTAASPTVAAASIGLRIERRTDDEATADFVSQALAILTDDRGWVRAGFRLVADDAAPYLLVLAEGDEVDRLCRPYDTGGRFSCQNGPVVALNADRWRTATEGWPGDLDTYRTYLVNHEVGHLLHLHHPSPQCPGPGLPAPVMLQQSTELGNCEPNPWPLPWEVDRAAARAEPLAPPADHQVGDHQPSPPPQQQDLEHRAG